MKRRGLSLLLAVTVVAGILAGCRRKDGDGGNSGNVESSQSLIDEAERLYAQREDLAKVRVGIINLKQARTADYGNYEVLWRLSKFNYYLGSHTQNDDERERAFRDGIDAGKAAVRVHDDRPEGHFWLGANYGGSAQSGVLAGLASVSDIRDQMQTVLNIEPGYEGASAYMVLGQVDLEAPKLMGGDPARAVDYLEKGNRLDNRNSMLKLRLAEAYLKTGRLSDARRELDEIKNVTPDPAYLPEHKEVLDAAKELRLKIDQRSVK